MGMGEVNVTARGWVHQCCVVCWFELQTSATMQEGREKLQEVVVIGTGRATRRRENFYETRGTRMGPVANDRSWGQ
jgi:hypothetical protein